MNPTLHAARLGVSRGWIETRNSLRAPEDTGFQLFITIVFVVVLFLQRNSTVEGTDQSLASVVLPGMVGMMVAVGGLMGTAGTLAVEREDGTLLRAKAVPHGMVGYLVAKIVLLSLTTLVMLALIFGAGVFVVPELLSAGLLGWLSLIGVIGLGLLATLPWGAVIGSLVRAPNAAFGVTMLPVSVLTAISGIFYPITALAGWVQGVAQLFPIYWLGHGMRAALLPDAAASAEITGAWRPLATIGVLGAWAVAGLLLAPPILRRMAARESGSAVAERRHRAMQRVN